MFLWTSICGTHGYRFTQHTRVMVLTLRHQPGKPTIEVKDAARKFLSLSKALQVSTNLLNCSLVLLECEAHSSPSTSL